MNTSIRRRLEKLSRTLQPSAVRSFTLEELCRLHWKLDSRGFTALTEETTIFRGLLSTFQREEADARSRTAMRGGPGRVNK
jgi:hypothetical protein